MKFSDSDFTSHVKGSLRVKRDQYIAELIQSGQVSSLPPCYYYGMTQSTKWFLGILE